jgi:hypothetical protein
VFQGGGLNAEFTKPRCPGRIVVVDVVADTFRFLLGLWDVERTVEDHLSGTEGSFLGSAVVVADPLNPATAHYEESGHFHLGTHSGPATRRLDVLRRDDSTAMLLFTDGRPFVDLDLRNGAWESKHPCAEDLYELSTMVVSLNLVQERWRVRGPETSYDAFTTLRRISVPEHPVISQSRFSSPPLGLLRAN